MKNYFQYPVSGAHTAILVRGYREIGIKYEGTFDIMAGIYCFPDDSDPEKVIYKALFVEDDSLFETFETEEAAAQYIEKRLQEEGYRDLTKKIQQLLSMAD